MSSIEKVQNEYPEDLCTLLEAAYGKGFLSEGGTEAIDRLVEGFGLKDKKILEIGSGMGGAALHLVQKFKALVTGVEINQPMVDEANKRVPQSLKRRLEFVYYNDINHLPFGNESFDFAFSKGVLLHLDVADKLSLFREIFRVLRPEARVIIGDWLSPVHGCWGKRMREVAELDNLSLFANTEEDYREIARQSGFKLISIDDDNEVYAKYNRDIADYLQNPETRKRLKGKFAEERIQAESDSYRVLSDAIREKELLIRRIVFGK
ncbi:MAG TPA: methyltransferase domain-containing protein [Candidatus Omnitrophota bacterium]|nr:methyltransferase domain-containing protein [Candidatus Omnitrophota bacterium]